MSSQYVGTLQCRDAACSVENTAQPDNTSVIQSEAKNLGNRPNGKHRKKCRDAACSVKNTAQPKPPEWHKS